MGLWGMIVSFNEIETTILKAARGAGMEWGLAEEAAQAARFLARLGLPFEAPLVNLLSTRAWETPPVLEGATLRPARPDASLCPVRAGAYLSDLGIAGAMIERLISPVLLLPFAARADREVEIAWKGVRLRLWPLGVTVISGEPCALAANKAGEVSLSSFDGADGSKGLRRTLEAGGGARIDEACWAKLQAFEALTYVPASAKSRASGAGAGEIDND
jgi:hypothetical protein